MLPEDDIFEIAKQLLLKYGSRSAISKHFDELVQEYGKAKALEIQAAVKVVRDETGIGKNRSLDTPERAEMLQKLKVLKSRYRIGVRYGFVVKDVRKHPDLSLVEDHKGWRHYAILPEGYSVGEAISCSVYGFYKKITPEGNVIVNLRLKDPRKLPSLRKYTVIDEASEGPVQYVKSPDKWYGEVIDLGKHKCGKPFTCSCCGKDFAANQGVRVDFKEIYFCNACKKLIYEPSGRGWAGRIISTPMGNKR